MLRHFHALVACAVLAVSAALGAPACKLTIGPFGPGSSGSAYGFSDAQLAATGGPITALQANSGGWMDSLQVTYGKTASPVHGGTGGSPNSLLTIAPGEYIVAVMVQTGNYVDSIQVTTSYGRSVMLGPGGGTFVSATPTCGTVNGRPPVLSYISGVGHQYLELIYFTWIAAPPSPPPLPPSPPPLARPPPLALAASVVLGPWGTTTSDPTFDEAGLSGAITQVVVTSGAWINSLQLSYGSTLTRVYGGPGGGSPQVLTLAPGEYITAVTARVGSFVDAMFFSTSKGRTMGLGQTASTAPQVWAAPCPVGRYRLVAIRGTAGQYLSSIQMGWAVLPGPPLPVAAPLWTCRYGINEVVRANGTQPQCLGMAGSTSCWESSSCWSLLPCAASSLLAPVNSCTAGVNLAKSPSGIAPTGSYQDPTNFCPRAQGALGLSVGPTPVPIQVVIVVLQVCNSGPAAAMSSVNTTLYSDPNSASALWAAVSFGRARFDPTTTTVAQVTLPCSAFSDGTCDFFDWVAYLDANAAALGVPSWPAFPYHRMIIGPNSGNYSSCGAGFQSGNNVYINGALLTDPYNYLNVIKHEMGHSIGLSHSSTWVNGANVEYGDESSPMGFCQRCSYAAPQLLQLGWATPIATLRGADLPPGGTLRFLLPALISGPVSTVAIYVDWARPSPPAAARPVGATPSVFLSYRVAMGQDVGLGAAYNLAVSVHSVASAGGSAYGGANTYLEAALQRGAAWSSTNFNLAVMPEAASAAPANSVYVRVCRFLLSASECGPVFAALLG